MMSCTYVLYCFFVVDMDQRVLFFEIEPLTDAMRLMKPQPEGFIECQPWPQVE